MATKYILFTYVPNPKALGISAVLQYDKIIAEYFRAWKRCMSEFEVNAELTVNGHIHFHGYYCIEDTYKWFKKVLPKMKYNGFWKANLINHSFEDGIKYCRKDRDLMNRILKDSTFEHPYCKYRIFDESFSLKENVRDNDFPKEKDD